METLVSKTPINPNGRGYDHNTLPHSVISH